MGVVQFEELKIRQQEVEVNALIALVKYGVQVQKFEALKHLEYIAYPEALAEKINHQQALDKYNEDF